MNLMDSNLTFLDRLDIVVPIIYLMFNQIRLEFELRKQIADLKKEILNCQAL